jgi:hypothetical protein
MRISLLGLVVFSLIGCATSDAELSEPLQQRASTTPVPSTSGEFVGHYVVPAPSTLASAATFAVPEVEWTVTAGVATLHYDLPVGLVGGDVSVTLTGTLAPGATTLQLTAGSGIGSCTAAGTQVTCSEDFGNLGAMPVSQTMVMQTAMQDGVAPASRVQVATLFGGDPIGTVRFDLSQPSEDGGGGHGGHGGGHGPH